MSIETVHGNIGGSSIIRNLWFTNPLVGQCRFFGGESSLGSFNPDKFMLKRKHDKRSYKAIVESTEKEDLLLDGITIIMMEPSDTFGFIEHYFHFCEHLITIWNALSIWNQKQTVKRVVLLSYEKPRWNWEGVNQINRYLIRSLFPDAQVITFDHLKKMAWRKTIRFDYVISSDRAVADREGNGKMLGASTPFINKQAMLSMASKVHESIGTTDEHKLAKRILISHRSDDRSMTPQVVESLKTMIRYQGCQPLIIDFAKFSFPEQLQFIRNADVLLGVHGNGLTHSLFLPAHGKTIEIFPPGSHLLEYRMLCETRSIRYHGIDPKKGEYTKKESYEIGEVIGDESMVKELPIDLIRRLI